MTAIGALPGLRPHPNRQDDAVRPVARYAPMVRMAATLVLVGPLAACTHGVTHQCSAPGTTLSQFASVALNSDGGCVLDRVGQMTCWGAEKAEQEGPRCPRSQPISGTYRKVVATEHAMCALDSSGSILCVGPPRKYVWLGTANTQASPLYSSEPFVDVAVGQLGVCGVTKGHSLRCLARDGWGGWLEAEQNVEEVSIGDAHACIRYQNGTVRCRGSFTDVGETRFGPYRARAFERERGRGPVFVLDGRATSVHSGNYHACAITEGGSLWCWGANHHGQVHAVARHTTEPPHLVRSPGKIALPGRVETVALGGSTSCALLQDGGVYCWGFGDNGLLGVADDGRHTPGTRRSVLKPKRVPLELPAKAIALGGNACNPLICVTLTSGQLMCWGSDASKLEEPGRFVRREGLALKAPSIEFAKWQRAPEEEYEWDPFVVDAPIAPLDRCIDRRDLPSYARHRDPLPRCSPWLDPGLDANEAKPEQLRGKYAVVTGTFLRYCTGQTKGGIPMCGGMFVKLGSVHLEATQLPCGDYVSFDDFDTSCNVDGKDRVLTVGGVFDSGLVAEWICQHD